MKIILPILILIFNVAQAQNQRLSKVGFSSFRSQLAFAQDQSLLAISEDNNLNLFSPQTLEKIRRLKGHTKTITSLLFCSDNKHLISSGLDHDLIYWDYLAGVIKSKWTSEKPILEADLIDDAKVAFITEKSLMGYDFELGKVLFSITFEQNLRAVSVSTEKRVMVVGTTTGEIKLYGQEGKLIHNWNSQNKNLNVLEISPSGKFIVAGYQDGKVFVFDDQGSLLATFEDAKKLIRCARFTLDEKYFAVGDDWGNCIIYSLNKKTIAEKIKIRNVPILALEFSPDGTNLITIASEEEISSWNIKRLGIASVFKLKDLTDRTPPQIFVSSPPNILDDKVKVYTDLLEIKGTVIDESGIRGVRVNGIEVPIKDNNNFLIFQSLSMGDNQFTLEAKDVNDNISIKRFTVQRKNLTGNEYDVSKARNFLFVVGINDYDYWPKLNNAVKDANDFTNSIITQYNFEFANLTMLKNEQATRSNIYKSLRSLIEQVTPQDNLLIYFSGHGYFDPLLNEGYWIPVEAKTNSIGDYLSNSDILKIIGSIDSQHTFLIADACFSGSLFSDSKRGYAENVEKYKSRWGLASGRLEVVSDGSVGKNSPFATATITFLNENTKEKVAISELIQYVKMKVAETSNQTPLGNPLKVLGDEGGEMVLYKKKN